jgi:hypothetical protein
MAEENREGKSIDALFHRLRKCESQNGKASLRMFPSPTDNAEARVARNKRIADRNLGLPNGLPRLETMDVDRAFILLDIMRCTHTTPNMTENNASKIS